MAKERKPNNKTTEIPEDMSPATESYVYGLIKRAITEEYPLKLLTHNETGWSEINTQDIRSALMPLYECLANGYMASFYDKSEILYVSENRSKVLLTPYLMSLLRPYQLPLEK